MLQGIGCGPGWPAPLMAVVSATSLAGPAVAQRPPAAPPKPTATFAPAQQGKAAYSNGCASCHGVNLGGGEFAGPLTGTGKMAIFEGLDAATGQYVFSKDLGVQNVVASIDPRTGDKTINPAAVLGDGKPHTICPHPGAGRPWLATSYNAATKTVYVPMKDACMDLIPAPPGQRGNLTSGYNWSIRPIADSDGKYVAIVVGSGGPETATYSVLVPEIRNPPQHGAAIWVFELPAKN